jgi:glucosamine--fructose-6-phosphate aminotransferase (isomerizing)
VRNGPPVVVASARRPSWPRIPAILQYTRNVVFLGDQEMAVVTQAGAVFSDFTGTVIAKTPTRVTWDPIAAEKAGYKHFMLKGSSRQPAAVRDTILGRVSLETGTIFRTPASRRRFTSTTASADCLRHSWHAASSAFLIEELARVPVEVDYGSEYRYRKPLSGPNTLAVAITQSGETADTLAALREAKQQGAKSLAICNVVGSMATRESDGTIYTHAGPEIGVASTKAFTSQLVALYLLALHMGQARKTLTVEQRKTHIADLLQLPQQIEQVLKCAPQIEDIASRFYNRTDFLYLGRGINYPIALEGALKLKEISYIHAEGYPAGEMKHGPIALIDERMPVVAIAPHDHVFEKMQGNIQEAKARGGAVIAITTAGDDTLWRLLDRTSDSIVAVPAMSPFLAPIVITVPLQLLSYHIAVRRGCDVDQPRNLAKSVTVE